MRPRAHKTSHEVGLGFPGGYPGEQHYHRDAGACGQSSAGDKSCGRGDYRGGAGPVANGFFNLAKVKLEPPPAQVALSGIDQGLVRFFRGLHYRRPRFVGVAFAGVLCGHLRDTNLFRLLAAAGFEFLAYLALMRLLDKLTLEFVGPGKPEHYLALTRFFDSSARSLSQYALDKPK